MIKHPVPECDYYLPSFQSQLGFFEEMTNPIFPEIASTDLIFRLRKRFYRPYNLRISSSQIDRSILKHPIWSKLKRRAHINALDLKANTSSHKSQGTYKLMTKLVTIACSIRNLNFEYPQNEATFLQISKCLQAAASLKKIQNVNIHLTPSTNLHENGLCNLLDLIALSYSKGITFSMLPNDEWTRDSCVLNRLPLTCPCLKSVQIQFPPHFDNINTISNMIKMSAHSKGLQKLALECPGTDMNDLSFMLLHNCLIVQPGLKSLKLELTGPRVNSISISNLFEEEFARLQLVEFSACFYNFVNLIDEVMKKLLDQLSKINTLENVNFNLDKCSVSDNSLQQFRTVLIDLQQLRRFSLRVGFTIGAVTNKSIQAITQGVRSALNLEHFGLELERKPGITDEGVVSLAENLRDITRLRSIKLCFPGCTRLTSRGIAILGQSLSMMRMLRSLVLNLDSDPEIDDDGVMPLITYLKRVKMLEQCRLSLKQVAISRDVRDIVSKYVHALPRGGLILST